MKTLMKIWGWALKLGPWLLIAIIVAAIFMGISAIKSCNSPKKPKDQSDYYKKLGFKPDTIRIHDTTKIPIPVPYEVKLPPKIVTIYDSGKYRPPIHDTIFKPLEPTLKSQYDGYNRLIYSEINRDTIRLDLYKPGINQVQTNYYPVNFNTHRYQVINNELRVQDRKPDAVPKKPFFGYQGTYVTEGHDFIKSSDNIGLVSSITIGPVRVGGYVNYPIFKGITLDPKQAGAGIRLGVKLF